MHGRNNTSFLSIFVFTFFIIGGVYVAYISLMNILFSFGLLDEQERYMPYSIYNAVLESQGKADIAVLLSTSLGRYEAEKYELLGDSLFRSSGSRETIISYYTQSYALEPHPRAREKLLLLQNSETTFKETNSGSSEIRESTPLSEIEEQASSRRIEEDAGKRGQYIRNNSQVIPDGVDFRIFLEETIDW